MAGKSKARSKARKKPSPQSKDEEHFTRGVIVRGEAVPKGAPLVPGATHEMGHADQEEKLVIRRKRFSAA